MITFITGKKGKSLIAAGIAAELETLGKNPFIFHESTTTDQIKKKTKKHSDILVCWQKEIPQGIDTPDMLINTTQPTNNNTLSQHTTASCQACILFEVVGRLLKKQASIGELRRTYRQIEKELDPDKAITTSIQPDP